MNQDGRPRVGFACAYTPLPLLHAAGFVPYRILPLGDAPDQAGSVIHDNMCPHIKKVLDRALAGELPPLAGLVFMASCDAMRRLAEAWTVARPDEQSVLVDLPVAPSARATAYLAGELERLRERLRAWSGNEVTGEDLVKSVHLYNNLAAGLSQLATRAARGALVGGHKILQQLRNRSVTAPPEEVLAEVSRALEETEIPMGTGSRVPVYLFGNVLADPEAFELFESCGAQVVDDDMCTGSRQLTGLGFSGSKEPLTQLAEAILARPPCARMLPGASEAALPEQVFGRARAAGARGVIAHVIKFCDPYLARLPALQSKLRDEGVPLLVLEGDCTLRSLGQHRTRIEAFVEMLSS